MMNTIYDYKIRIHLYQHTAYSMLDITLISNNGSEQMSFNKTSDKKKHITKGISPLIAAVLLIAFTMAIAGIMATWATTFSSERLSSAQKCVFSIEILDMRFSSGNVTVRIGNNLKAEALTGFKASIIYEDGTKNKDSIDLSAYNLTSLAPLERKTVVINTNEQTRPVTFEIVSLTCSGTPVRLNF